MAMSAEDGISAEDTTPEAEYDAFISYSRRDMVFARALEKTLEAYRPPRDLPVAQRHLRVFRDETDFTGTDYADAIRRHLAASRKLIVLCSPAARASRYVDEEVRLFGEQRGAPAVIPLLIAGLPNNEAGSDREAERAFPDSLCRLMAMPLATDYRNFDAARPHLDRGIHEASWFKLLADLYGLPRSEVEQREKRRQARVRRLWMSGIGAVMAALAGLSVWALLARAEAIRQREIAAAGLVTAQARSLVGAETETAERQALLALEALRRLREQGGATDDAQAVLSTALGRLPQRIHDFESQAERPLLAFSADGLRLFRVAGLRLESWNLRQVRIERVLELQRPVTRLMPSPDGQWLAAIDGDGGIGMHFVGVPAVGGASQKTGASPANAGVVCGVFSRDGGLFAALRRRGPARHEVVVWRPADGSIRGRLNLPSNIEVDVAGGSGPCLIFSAEQDVSGISSPLTLLATFRSAAEPEATSALAWRLPAASAQTVAPDTPASPNVRTWSRVAGAGFDADGTRLLLTRSDPRRQAGELLSVAVGNWQERSVSVPEARIGPVSPDGWRFTTRGGFAEDPYVPLLKTTLTEVRDTIDGSVRAELPLAGRFSADGSRFLGTDGTLVRMWELRGGQESVRLTARTAPAGVLDAPGGRYLALIAEDHSVELWDTGHPRELSRIAGVRAGRLSGPGRFVSVTGAAGTRLVDVGGGHAVALLQPAGSGLDMVAGPDGARAIGPFVPPGTIFLAGPPPARQRLIDLGGEGRTLWEGESAVRAAFSVDGSLVAGAHADGTLRALRTADGSQVWQVALGKTASQLQWSRDGRTVLAALAPGSDGKGETVVLDAVTGSVKLRLPGAAPTALSLDPMGQRLAVAESARVTVFDVAGGGKVAEVVHPPSLGHVGAVVLQPDGQRLATLAGSRASTFLGASFYTEQAAFVWDLATGQTLARIAPGQDRAADYPETLKEEEKAYLNGAMLSADGRAVAGTVYPSRRVYWIVRADRAAKDAVVWDLTGVLPREILRIAGMEVEGISEGGEVALLGGGNTLQVWSLDRADLDQAACARLSRGLDAAEWKAYFGDEPYHSTCGRTVPF